MRTPCQLCSALEGGINRPNRLGRYATTCDRCEARRGTHLNPPHPSDSNVQVADSLRVDLTHSTFGYS